ncbi:uncharacterized protein [Rutidosis leptorrhynchoides]|uniref:uncharacterized protein n=1 Tax=Rutidosis leptorrhynchoides TaxID=125765 RepID=UPI003A99415F
MSMYGYDASVYDYGFSDSAFINPLFGNPITAGISYDDELYVRRPPPPRQTPPITNPSINPPEQRRHDGNSPLPLGMDWSLPPRIWEGRNSVWPHESNKRWSYCVTVPSWTVASSANGSDTVFFRVQVGIQSPEGITSTREVLRRFNEFLQLYSELRKEFPKKDLPTVPPKRLMKMRSKTLLEERRCALDGWLEKLLSDIDVSRTAYVAIFLELEAAARQACTESTQNDSSANPVPPDHSLLGSSSSVSSNTDIPSESVKGTAIDQLQKELIDAKEEIEILRKSNSELKQELSKCLEENKKLEKEKQIREAKNVLKLALIHKCEELCNRLRGCSINFILDDEDKLMADTSLSDAVDLLETSDSQINLLLTEVQLLRKHAESSSGPVNQNNNSETDDELGSLLGDILTENAELRKQVNSVIRHTLTNMDDKGRDGDDQDDNEIVM